MKGVESAAAIGIIGGKLIKNLKYYQEVTQEDIQNAKRMLDNGQIFVSLKGEENLDIEIVYMIMKEMKLKLK